MMGFWEMSNRADPEVVPLADRHYNRQKVGSPQFAPPGRCLVLKKKRTPGAAPEAFWITSWPYAQYVKHAWAGFWVCSAFRNEGRTLSSELIREAVACSRAFYGDPEFGIVSFVDPTKVKPKRDFGYCYLKAGFERDGETKGGLLAFVLRPGQFPCEKVPPGFAGRHKHYRQDTVLRLMEGRE